MPKLSPPSIGKRGTGRPPKFAEPRRPVTVTLPERILRLLQAVDADRAHAIAKVTETVASATGGLLRPVEIVPIATCKALIVVGICPSLKHIAWLRLVEIAPGRFLLSIPSGTAIETLEVALLDLLDNLTAAEEADRRQIEELRGVIGKHRRRAALSKEEILFIGV